MNFAEIAIEDRPALETREMEGGAEQVQCPICSAWRPLFCLVELSPEDAISRGADWACDGDITRWAREEI